MSDSVLESVGKFLDAIPGEARTPDNCPIRAWHEANKHQLDGMNQSSLAYHLKEALLIRELYNLPDWNCGTHCYFGIMSSRDYDPVRKRLHQLYAFTMIMTKGTHDEKRWAVMKLLQEENKTPGLLAPAVAWACHSLVTGGLGAQYGMGGLLPALARAYKDAT